MLKQQRINCIKLMLGILNTPPPIFEMRYWAQRKIREGEIDYMETGMKDFLPNDIAKLSIKDHEDCGTTCCFLGAGAVFGIGNPENCWNFCVYAHEDFGIHNPSHPFLFDSHWPSVPEQAAARMQVYLNATEDERTGFLDMGFDSSTEHVQAVDLSKTYPELEKKDITKWKKEITKLEKEITNE